MYSVQKVKSVQTRYRLLPVERDNENKPRTRTEFQKSSPLMKCCTLSGNKEHILKRGI